MRNITGNRLGSTIIGSGARPAAYRRRRLRRVYPTATALLAAWGDEEAERALVTVDSGGTPCRVTGGCA